MFKLLEPRLQNQSRVRSYRSFQGVERLHRMKGVTIRALYPLFQNISLSTGEEDAAQLYGKAPWSFTATLY
jgi:hypothetical protein